MDQITNTGSVPNLRKIQMPLTHCNNCKLNLLLVTCWERAYLLVLLCVMLTCVFVTFLYGILGQVWHLIVLVPDLCLLPYFTFAACIYSIPLTHVSIKISGGSIGGSGGSLEPIPCPPPPPPPFLNILFK